jgi:hypothetical protein
MRSDAQIQHDVYEHLKWDPRVNENGSRVVERAVVRGGRGAAGSRPDRDRSA